MLHEPERLEKLARFLLFMAILVIGYGLSSVWPPLVFFWVGAWLLALVLVTQNMANERQKGDE